MKMQSLDHLKNEKVKVGIKQCLREINEGKALELYVAQDAQPHVLKKIISLAGEKNISIHYVSTMKELGRACNIDVGAATAVILNNNN
jgi:large subunit ribosomal protein L7A